MQINFSELQIDTENSAAGFTTKRIFLLCTLQKSAKHLLLKFNIFLYNHVQMSYQKKTYEKISKYNSNFQRRAYVKLIENYSHFLFFSKMVTMEKIKNLFMNKTSGSNHRIDVTKNGIICSFCLNFARKKTIALK